MDAPRTVTLVYGPTAAGKSTFARKLAADQNAVHLAVDEWMHTLFAIDAPPGLDLPWVMARVARCRSLMWATAERILGAGVDVVLEFGLTRKGDRDEWTSRVEAAGHNVALCFVDAALELRRQRVLQRNADRDGTHSFEITPRMFEAIETMFERPSFEEQARSMVVRS